MEKMNHELLSYKNLLNPPLRILGAYADQFLTTPKLSDKAKMLFEVITPFIQKTDELKDLRKSWTFDERKILRLELKKQSQTVFKNLYKHLQKKQKLWEYLQELNEPNCFDLTKIDDVLEVNPLEGFKRFQCLCKVILEQGEKDLISEYVVCKQIIQYELNQQTQQFIVDPLTNQPQTTKRFCVDYHKKESSIYQLCELERALLCSSTEYFDRICFYAKIWNCLTYSAKELDVKQYQLNGQCIPQIFFDSLVKEITGLKYDRYTCEAQVMLTEQTLTTILKGLLHDIFRYNAHGYMEPSIPEKPKNITISMPETNELDQQILLALN